MKSISQSYSKAQALIVAAALVDNSRWFEVMPYPFDVYHITTKDERLLPEPVGVDNLKFADWITLVGREIGVEPMAADRSEAYREYFLRGMTPAEAIYEDRKNGEV